MRDVPVTGKEPVLRQSSMVREKRRKAVKSAKLWGVPLYAVLFFLAGASPAFAQGGKGGPRQGPSYYDPSTEVTAKGTVEHVRQVTGRRGWWTGTHVTVKTAKETLDVHVGPSWSLAKKKFTLAKGDQIEVTGSKIKYQGADALIAREVKKGKQILVLRNAQGIPEWSRGRRRY